MKTTKRQTERIAGRDFVLSIHSYRKTVTKVLKLAFTLNQIRKDFREHDDYF
jgi:hypothetical protein